MAKLLVAEDAELLRRRVANILSEAGYQVIEAENGKIALDIFKMSSPDLVLLDISMPEMDGLVALKAVRDHEPQARVIMLSALGQEAAVLEAMKSGANDFVMKPFERERVLSAISTLLD